MFTGIIEERGRVVRWDRDPDGGARLTVHAPLAASDARHGDSIAVSGVCLTVVDRADDGFTADVMGQTLAVSAIADLAPGDAVNLERAARVGDRLGGHIVQGHVDGVGTVLDVRDEGSWRVVRVALPADLAPLVVDKGSISVAGVSLTVSAVGTDAAPHAGADGDERPRGARPHGADPHGDQPHGDQPHGNQPHGVQHWFEVSLIPETLAATTLGAARPGVRVNLETDIVARHVQRMLALNAVPHLQEVR